MELLCHFYTESSVNECVGDGKGSVCAKFESCWIPWIWEFLGYLYAYEMRMHITYNDIHRGCIITSQMLVLLHLFIIFDVDLIKKNPRRCNFLLPKSIWLNATNTFRIIEIVGNGSIISDEKFLTDQKTRQISDV